MEAKPTIFIFTTAYHPFIGGAEIAVAEVARRLGGAFRFLVITARFRKDLAGREERPEGTVIRVGLGRFFDKWLLLFLGPLAALREFRRIGALRPLLWGMDISFGSAAAALLKCVRPRLPFVLSVQYGYGGKRLGRGRIGLIGLGYRFMLARADAVTAISSFLASTAKRFGWRRKVAIIPNGVAIERFGAKRRERRPGTAPIIITVSRLVPKNGIDTLVLAIAQLRNYVTTQLKVKLHILGDGPERASLEALAKSSGLGEQVKFFGDIPNEEIPRHLADADIFVRPSRSEGMGNAFMEALAAGLPIVGTPVEGILDIIADGKTGLFAKVNDPADVAAKILRLIRDPELARSIVANGRAMAEERFSWHKIAADYGRIFNAALAPAILIATPQFPPDIGGPGSYAEKLAEHFLAKSCKVTILSYGSQQNLTRFDLVSVLHSWPSGLKHFIYFLKAFRLLLKNDAALVLDPVIVGFPAAWACRMLARPVIIRVEGDFLWEWFSERTKKDLTLRQFYEKFREQPISRKERLMYRIAHWVFSQGRYAVFSSHWRKDIFELGCPLEPGRVRIISSPWPAGGGDGRSREKVILFAGRFIHIKNLKRLVSAFAAVFPPDFKLELIGEGPERRNLEFIIHNSEFRNRVMIMPPLGKSELLGRIASAYAFLLPSLSDVSPNVILDCIASGTPFLLTKESGFYETLKDVGVFVDPQNKEDIVDKLRLLLDPEFYADYRKRLGNFKKTHSWGEVSNEWLDVIRSAV